ncbi:phage tail tape measure protein [Paenibacillus alvei]|uniref:Phage tail tape measure protein n=1 Tax=Paenibacillus alvei TaxID=44250 RepID=A0ABT4E620_PAEAL|nr:phage tail tape measure protein [Paenibacillus alvei]MCY9529172.1 phage tail tape measure protein [Paenibacillus alvei]
MARVVHTILQLKDKYSQGIMRAGGRTEETRRQVQFLDNKVRGFKSSAVSAFTSATKSAAGMTAGFVALAGSAVGLVAGTQFATEMSSSLAQLRASTGATASETAALKREVADLYKQNIGESWSDLATSMATAKQVTGQTGEALKETTRQAVIYRDVFGEEVSQSIKASDTMMKNFGITSAQSYSLLVQGAQKGLNKSDELIDSANEYAPYFATLGFTADQMFDTFAAGLEKGAFNLDKVGDAVKEFNIRVKDDSKGTNEAFESLGLNAKKMAQTFAKGGPDAQKAFKQVVAAISSVKDPVQKNTIGVQLFGTMFEDLEKDVVAAMGSARKQFDMTKDSINEIADAKYSDIGSAFRGIKRDIEVGLFLPIAEKALPKVNEFATWVKSNMPNIRSWVEDGFAFGQKAIDGFSTAIKFAKDNAKWLTPVVVGLTAAIAAQKIVSTVTGLYKTWKTVTTGLTAAQAIMNVVMAANPLSWIALAIGAVVAAGVLLWQNWDTVKTKASELWTWLTEVWQGIREATMNAFDGVADKVKGAFENVVTFIKTPINAVINMINQVIDGLNSVSFTAPDWIPEWLGGGKTVGVNVPKIPNFKTGTGYFSGGLARTDEHGGEIKEYPNGTKVIPHDLSKRMLNGQGEVTINVYVQGNVIGNEEYANYMGNHIAQKVLIALGNV